MKKNVLLTVVMAVFAWAGYANIEDEVNLVSNADFSSWADGVPVGWDKAENCTMNDVDFHTAPYAVEQVGGIKDLTQTVLIEGGKTYTVSFWYKTKVVGDGTDSRIWSVWKNGTTTVNNNDDTSADPMRSFNGYLPNVTVWTEHSIEVTAPAEVGALFFEVRTYSGATTLWDDFSVVEMATVVPPTPVLDTIPPVWADGYPAVGNETDTSFQMLLKLNEASIVYGFGFVYELEVMPTIDEIKAIARTEEYGDSIFIMDTEELAMDFPADLGDSIYIYLFAADTAGNIDSTVYLIMGTPKVVPTVITSETFDTDLGAFTAYSVEGTATWAQAAFGSNGYAKINSFGLGVNEAWLVSPQIDLTTISMETVSFGVASYVTGGIIGDNGTQFEVYYSTTAPGASIVMSDWTRFTEVDAVALSATRYAFTDVSLDLSTLGVDTLYIAFRHKSGENDGNTWEVDNCQVSGILDNTKNAILSELNVNGKTIEGFDPAVKSYIYHLPMGQTEVPSVEGVPVVDGADVLVIPATDLNGDVDARTTTVEVTAKDMVTKEVYSVLFNPSLSVGTIAELRAAEPNRIYGLGNLSIVTATNSYKNRRFIQDATGGIMIYDASKVLSTVLTVGDSIKGLLGFVSQMSGMTVITPVSTVVDVMSSANAVSANIITMSDLKNNLSSVEGEYVTIQGVAFVAPGTTIANGKNYEFFVGTDTAILRTDFFNAVSGDLPSTVGNMSGVVLSYYGTPKLVPTSNADFDFVASALRTHSAIAITLYPNPATSTIQLTKAVESVEFISLSGRTLLTAQNVAANASVDVSSLASGVYFVKVTAEGQSVISKLIKE